MRRLSCPFCSCETTDIERQQHYGERFWIRCCLCGARGPVCHTKTQAIAGWQKTHVRTDGRPAPSPVPIDLTTIMRRAEPQSGDGQ